MSIFSRVKNGVMAAMLVLMPMAAGAETVLITGANTGIGLGLARHYAAEGWTVIATHRRDTTPDTLRALEEQYPKVRAERMDVTDREQIYALAKKLEREPVDVLINNAGLMRFDPLFDREGNKGQKFGTLDYDHFDQFMRTNVAGPLMISEAFVDHLRRSERKQLVNISTRAAVLSQPRASDHYWYRISKTALNSAMTLVAQELKDDGVVVSLIHPGGVQSESLGDQVIPGAIPPLEAAQRIAVVIEGLTIADTGRFMNNDGTDHPW